MGLKSAKSQWEIMSLLLRILLWKRTLLNLCLNLGMISVFYAKSSGVLPLLW